MKSVNYEFSILAWLGWKTTVETVVLLNNLADDDKICPTFSVNDAVNTVNVTIALITCLCKGGGWTVGPEWTENSLLNN